MVKKITAFLQAVSRKKSSQDSHGFPLSRCLSTADLSFIGIGSMMGSGVYILTGEVVAEMAGPAAIISFVLAAFASVLSALCYVECALRFPQTGACYLYTYITMGELMAFVIGWNSFTIRGLAVIFIARGWSAYFDHSIGWRVANLTMDALLDGERWQSPLLQAYPDILGGIIAFAACILVAMGTKVSARVSSIFVAINIATITFTIIMSFVHADYSNLTENGGFAPMGVDGVLKGMAACFIGYCGFESVAFGAEETKDPKKSVPIAITASFIAAISMFTMGTFAIVILANWMEIDPKSAFVSGFNYAGVKWMSTVICVGAVFSMTGGIINNAFCFARALYVMGRDGLLPARFATTNETTQTPVFATMFGAILLFMITMFINFATVVEAIAIMYLFELVNVALVCILLRYRRSEQQHNGYDCIEENMVMTNEDEDTGQALHLEDDNKQCANISRDIHSSLSLLSNKGRIHKTSSSFTEFKRLINDRSEKVIICCLLVIMTNTLVIGYIVCYMMDKLLHGYVPIICLLLVDVSLVSISCVPFYFLEQNVEEVPFKVPLMPVLPIVSIVFNVFLMMRFELMTWVQVIAWTAIGLCLYFCYGIHHSKEAV